MAVQLNLKISDGGIRRVGGGSASRGSARGAYSAAELQQKIKDNPGFKLKGDTLVTGSDDAAIDAALASLRCGSDSVAIVFPQRREEVYTTLEKATEAEAAGIKIACGWGQPTVDVHRDGRVSGATFCRCKRAFDAEGEFNPTYDDADTMARYCDNLVFA